jgi:hypothetical protein
MRSAARGRRCVQHGFSIMRGKSPMRQGIMRKKASRESLDSVKLVDSRLAVSGREIAFCCTVLNVPGGISCPVRGRRY